MTTSTPDDARRPETRGVSALQQTVVAVLAFVFLLYPFLFSSPTGKGGAVGNELVGDGLELVTQHPVLLEVQNDPSQLGKTLSAGWWQGVHDNQQLYRPLSLFTLGLAGAAAGPYDEKLPGNTPLPYHFLVVLLNIGCALLVLDVAFLILGSARAAFIAAALFAVLPVHGEVLFDVVGIAELLCTALSLAAWGAWLRAGDKPSSNPAQLVLCLLFLFMATLAKESAFALPLVFFALDIGRAKSGGFGDGLKYAFGKLPGLVACAVVLGLSYGLRTAVLDGGAEYLAQNKLDNPLIFESGLTRAMNGVRILAAGIPIMLGINPLLGGIGFSPDYSFNQIPVLGAFALPNLLGLAAVLGLLGLALVFYTKCRTRAGLVLALLASMLVTSNILFPIGTVFGERLLFFPSVALVLLVASFLNRLGSPGTLVGLVGATACGLLLFSHTGTWESNSKLWSHAAKVAPDSAKAHYNNGKSLFLGDIYSYAKGELERALEIHPEFVQAHVMLGAMSARSYEFDQAVAHYARGLEIQLEESGYQYRPELLSPTGPTALLYYISQIRIVEAPDPAAHLAYLDGLVAKGYHSPVVEHRRAEALFKLNRIAEADAAYEASIELGGSFDARRSYGEFLVTQGRNEEAQEVLNPAADSIASAGDRNELLIARGWAQVGADPAAALRIAEDLLEGRDTLSAQQLFHVKHLQATAKLDLYDQDPSAGPERLEEIKKNLMGGISAWPVQTEDAYVARRMLARLRYVLNENEEAVSEIENLLEFRDGPAHRTMLGEVYTRLGQLDKAVEQFERASAAQLNDDGTYVAEDVLYEARRHLLLAYTALEQEVPALAAIDSWHESAPGEYDKMALYLHANWLASQRDLDGALEQARMLASAFPDEPRAEPLMLQLERMMELTELLDAGKAGLPELDELARLRFGFDDFDGAVEVLTQALALTDKPSNQAGLEQMISDSLEAKGDLPAALEHARKALTYEGVPAEARAMWQKRLSLLEVTATR